MNPFPRKNVYAQLRRAHLHRRLADPMQSRRPPRYIAEHSRSRGHLVVRCGWSCGEEGVSIATDTVAAQASGGRVVEAWWFGFLVRSALALLALWTLSFAEDRYRAFGLEASTNFRYDSSLWLTWAGAMVAAASCSGWRRGCHSPSFASCRAVCCWPLSRCCRSCSYWLLLRESRSRQASGPKHLSSVHLQVHRRILAKEGELFLDPGSPAGLR
jgi:hypothetical protein